MFFCELFKPFCMHHIEEIEENKYFYHRAAEFLNLGLYFQL